MTRSKAIDIAVILGKATLSALGKDDMMRMVRNNIKFAKIESEWEETRGAAHKRLKPEGWDGIEADLMRSVSELSAERRAEVIAAQRAFDKNLHECLDPLLDEEIEVDVETISEDGLYNLIKANDVITGKGAVLLSETLTAPAATPEP